MALIFSLVAVLYAVQCIIFIYGILTTHDHPIVDSEPRVSIVVAARNEERFIKRCISSLVALDYPKNKLEIIIIDDNSTDGTTTILREFERSYPNVKTLSAKQGIDQLRGKANAIAQGIDVSSGEIIMMTDADCAVPPSWVRGTVQYYTDNVGVVAGLTLLHADSWFAGMQSLDWAYILAVASASMSLKNPLSCIGNNFSFRKAAYDEIGGYRGIKFSVTEDFALFKAITRSGRWEYHYPLDEKTLVFSDACSSPSDLFRQKKRWGVGGKDMPLSGLLIMAVAFCMHAFVLLGLVLQIQNGILLTAVLGKLFADFFLVSIPLFKTKQQAQLKYFAIFEVYYILYVIALPFMVFLGGKVVWKGREYSSK
ncbi:MAG TPA: glycosyltransferase [Bacteroidota bacterium]|nr:glycosyltransferase [Bacteroidota bacterium]